MEDSRSDSDASSSADLASIAHLQDSEEDWGQDKKNKWFIFFLSKKDYEMFLKDSN